MTESPIAIAIASAIGTPKGSLSVVPTATSVASASAATATTSNRTPMRPTDTIVVPNLQRGAVPPPPDPNQRAIHRIRLSALQHNFACVESAANRQRCSVIVVVKADGYGHGAIATALHLADRCGADSFAVATLEEAIALRRAFENNPPGRWTKNLASHFYNVGISDVHSHVGTTLASQAGSDSSDSEAAARVMRPSMIRILVLGPPVGYPRCFDDYYHHGVEVMVSGPEVATALLEWLANDGERKRTQVERAAMEAKALALTTPLAPRDPYITSTAKMVEEKKQDHCATVSDPSGIADKKVLRHPSSTLGNVSGQDLAKEVRALLMSQKAATDAAQSFSTFRKSSAISSGAPSPESSVSGASDPKLRPKPPAPPPNKGQVFCGIEAASKNSRVREQAVARANEVFKEDSACSSSVALSGFGNALASVTNRKRLRWHALVDSGMGRLGFRTDPIKEDDDSGRRDMIEILQELLDAEIHGHAPIEFYGMCTHMADANSKSDYTNSQISKFIDLLKRVRGAGISVPTVSTDNSAALLTTNLTHFDPNEILTQPDAHTRGYVRTGGAIYGQRPAFTQLKAVSSLLASVRHVAILKQGESVGYDRAYIAPRDVRIATLTVGFADGYPRELGNGVGKVAIRGALFPLAGNVCMDMLMVELGPAEAKEGVGATVVVGDVAVLWGPMDEDEDEGLLPLAELAATLKTTQSALTCGLDKIRVIRQFV